VRNYNKLLELYPGADGMKTGFICASGFNLVASATRDNRRLIAVVLGAPSSAVRAYKAAKLLEQGFTGSNKLAWLIPSKGTVDQLPAIDAPPPDLREEMCGPHRKRPAAEDEEVDMSSVSEDGKTNPLAFMLSSLHGTVKAGKVLGAAIASLPPVDVFVGAFKPGSAVAAEKQESQLAGWSPKKRAAKKAKAAKTKTAAASGDKPDKADAKEAAKKEGAKPASSDKAAAKPAKSAKPAAKSAAAKSATTSTTK
jgi:D-alanyl-D-alanine carboxypeptidase